MSNIAKNYFRVLEVLSSLNIALLPVKRAGRKPKMSDLEVVALSLTAEFMSIDSENSFFGQLQNGQIANLIERSRDAVIALHIGRNAGSSTSDSYRSTWQA